MKIIRLAEMACDLDELHERLKRILSNLSSNSIGKAKFEAAEAVRDIERIRPHLKYKNLPVRGRI